ncbi:hypothetical protein WA026_003849 [Henosepilachna vigintioctopunctata]|uniref:Timeless C-terminal domain-containing protein n=1 Tax=Henosepilachna vigintioctopunctata TaxID=420089 RepID=A0AAW1UD28_9CUCU
MFRTSAPEYISQFESYNTQNDVAVQQQPIYDENDEEEEDEGGIEFSERDLKFEDFAKRLAHPKIIRAAALALSRFEENSVNTNNCIIKLLHRIAFDCKMYVMLFQVSLFMTFRKIYAMKEMPEYKELVKFSTYILRQFFKIAQENKKIYLETLFWKSTKDAFDVEHGYGSYQEKSSAAARAWTEEEEDEVRRLFMEHKEKQLEDDVVDWVLSNLIDNTRTRRGVFKKMKELYLLTDYKGKKKPRLTSRLQQQWTADEEEQLIELYEQFKEAMDPLDCIMSRLDTPRQKNRIIEKLLVLGVIQDRKEVRKKRVKMGTKSKSGGARHNPRRSDDSSDSDASGDDATRRTTASSNPPRSAGPTKKKKPKKTGVVANVSPRRLAELTLGIMQAGMNEALNWLKESFEDAIEDYEDDADEGIPLVPIMDHAVKAMEDEDFHNLLLALGIAKPSDEQEAYWRIPSDMNLETMKSYQELFRKALENNLTIPEEELQVPVTSEIQDMESSDEDVFAQLRRSTVKVINEEAHEQASGSRDTIKRRRESSSDDIPETGETEALVRKQKPKKKKTRVVESNILNDEENSHQIEEDTNVDEIINVRKSNRRVIDDDDSNNSTTVPELNAERIKGSDSSSDEDIFDKLKKLSNINSSEVESENEIRVKRRRRVFKPEENGTNEGEDLLAVAEEKLKNERRKKNLAKKEKKKKSNSKKNSNDGEKAKTEKKTKKAAPKAPSSTNFKSKEFISSEDDSSDDEESKRRVEEHYEKLLHKDFQENKERKEITSKTLEEENNSSSEDEQVVSKKVTTSDKAKTNEDGMTGSSDENTSDTEENSSNNEPNKENIDTNKTSNNVAVAKPKKLRKVVFSSDDD